MAQFRRCMDSGDPGLPTRRHRRRQFHSNHRQRIRLACLSACRHRFWVANIFGQHHKHGRNRTIWPTLPGAKTQTLDRQYPLQSVFPSPVSVPQLLSSRAIRHFSDPVFTLGRHNHVWAIGFYRPVEQLDLQGNGFPPHIRAQKNFRYQPEVLQVSGCFAHRHELCTCRNKVCGQRQQQRAAARQQKSFPPAAGADWRQVFAARRLS